MTLMIELEVLVYPKISHLPHDFISKFIPKRAKNAVHMTQEAMLFAPIDVRLSAMCIHAPYLNICQWDLIDFRISLCSLLKTVDNLRRLGQTIFIFIIPSTRTFISHSYIHKIWSKYLRSDITNIFIQSYMSTITIGENVNWKKYRHFILITAALKLAWTISLCKIILKGQRT